MKEIEAIEETGTKDITIGLVIAAIEETQSIEFKEDSNMDRFHTG